MTIVNDGPACYRWEWRAFAPSLAYLEAKIGRAADVPAHETTESYLLSERDDLNLKVRNGCLDLKCLDRTDEEGLELWKPTGRADFPAPAESIAALLASLGLSFQFHGTITLEKFLQYIAGMRELQIIHVKKRKCQCHSQPPQDTPHLH